MNCIVTILQNKRVAMPYIFNKYCVPMMLRHFDSVKVFHVFHDRHTTTGYLSSNKDMGRNHVDKVKRFIDNQAFGDAITISHQTTSDTWPIIPSLKIAAKITQKEHTDFHLWLEDDAIAYDISCNSWATTLGSADVGLYANTASKQLINTAYFVSTPEFDLRYSRILDEYKKTLNIPTDERWAYFNRRGSITEYLAYRASREQVYLGPNKVFRHHPHPTHKKTGKMVRAWLKEHIPHITTKDLELTYLDFDD